MAVGYTRPYLYPKQLDALFCPERWAVCEASTKSGKAQPLDATIWTPYGPKTMGDVKVGDYVIAIDGTPTKVVGVYPQGKRQTYTVTFNDNTVVECDGEHLWKIEQSRYPTRLHTTLELAGWPEWKRIRAYVPKIQPVQFQEKEVDLDPYLVGVIIGDGNTTTEVVRFTTADHEILKLMKERIPVGHELRNVGGYDWHITAGNKARDLSLIKETMAAKLRAIGLMGKYAHEKFIPTDYLYNSIQIRLQILRGIMDTDGSLNQKGQPILEQSSYQLARDVEELVQSLGGSVLTVLDKNTGYWNSDGDWIIGRPRYRQVIRLRDFDIFMLERKLAKIGPQKKAGNRTLRDIKLCREVEVQCIEVEHHEHLYLTEGFIPTHNTVGSMAWLLEEAFKGKPGWNYWWGAPVSSQADIANTRFKNGLTRGSFTPRERHGQPTITLANGAILWFKSADKPDSLYGEDVYAAVVDEASRWKEPSWHAIRSTLTATRGACRIIGNVKGRKNWFYRLGELARNDMLSEPDPRKRAYHYSKITAYDAVAAGVLDSDEIEDAKRMLPEHVFRELYLAEPSDDGGNPFGLQHIAACIADGLSTHPVVAWGIDLAKKHDYLVIIGLDAYGNVAAFERWHGRPWPDSIREIHRLVGEDTPALVDSTGIGDPVLDQLQVGHGNFHGYMFSPASKQKLMEGLSVSIQSHEIHFPDGVIRSELESFEYVATRTGVSYSAPEGDYFDDCVCALALARQQWAETAPGASLMEFYSQQAKLAKERAAIEIPVDDLGLRGPLVSHKEVVDNELTELYRNTLAQYAPQQTMCYGCGERISGPTRVSDGEFVWHPECVGLRRAA